MDWVLFSEKSPIDLSRGPEGVIEPVPSVWRGTPAEDPLGLSSQSYSKERKPHYLMECDNPELFNYLDWYWRTKGTFSVLSRPSTEVHFPENYFPHTSTPTQSGQTYGLLQQGRDQRPRTDSPRHQQPYQKHHSLLSNYYSMTTASPRSSRSQVNIRHPRDRDLPRKYEQYPSTTAVISDLKRRYQRSPVNTTSQQRSERWFSERKYVEQEALYGKRSEAPPSYLMDYEIRYSDSEIRNGNISSIEEKNLKSSRYGFHVDSCQNSRSENMIGTPRRRHR